MLTVGDMMVCDPVVVEHDTSVHEALRAMIDGRINSVVVRRDGAVAGIFTPRDLLHRTAAQWQSTAVSELMTHHPVTIAADESFACAESLMQRRRVRHLPVTEDGALVGMLSVRDLMQHRTEHLEAVVEAQTVELEQKNGALRERNRLMNYHLDLAGRIQRQLLPTAPPDFPPFALSVRYHPLDHVSGDCYDFVMLGPDRIGILIADASGHGVPAAFVSVAARTIFQAYGRSAGASPAGVLRTMNAELPCLIEEERFITMCYAALDRRAFRLTYATAGHPPPLWYRRQLDRVEALEGSGTMIGVVDDPDFEDHTVQLARSDALLFLTDGVLEAMDEAKVQFGSARTEAVLRSAGAGGAEAIVTALEHELRAFCGPGGFDDDVTCIALAPGGGTGSG